MLTTLRELVQVFLTEKPIQIISPEQVDAQAVAALRFYLSWAWTEDEYRAELSALPKPQTCSLDSCLSFSDWGLVKPLFALYVERETAIQLEASRGMGVDVFGRSVSEIAGDIRTYEDGLPRWAFSQPILSLGLPE